MFVVECTDCGRKQEWKTGTDLTTTAMSFAGNRLVCDCGSMIELRDWVLYEGKVED